MNTNDLINDLAKDAKPYSGPDSIFKFLLKMGGYWLAVILFSYIVLPFRSDLSEQLTRPTFYVETWLWLACAFMSSVMVYRHSIPGLKINRFEQASLFLMMGLSFIIPFATEEPGHSILEEMNLERGTCGFLILGMSVVGTTFFFHWCKKLLPQDFKATGFWIAVSSATFGCFVMQLVCAHNTSHHIYIWHFIPMVALGWICALSANKLLKW